MQIPDPMWCARVCVFSKPVLLALALLNTHTHTHTHTHARARARARTTYALIWHQILSHC